MWAKSKIDNLLDSYFSWNKQAAFLFFFISGFSLLFWVGFFPVFLLTLWILRWCPSDWSIWHLEAMFWACMACFLDGLQSISSPQSSVSIAEGLCLFINIIPSFEASAKLLAIYKKKPFFLNSQLKETENCNQYSSLWTRLEALIEPDWVKWNQLHEFLLLSYFYISDLESS